ncbi:hypothetical protein BDV12DRAFT_90933 [Aspergillus spectabilis]
MPKEKSTMARPVVTRQHALNACIQCANARRKCDRLLPSCSRCIISPRFPQLCLYEGLILPAVFGHEIFDGLTLETSVLQLGAAPNACVGCREGKRQCTRALPQCSRCERLGRSCDYALETAPQIASPPIPGTSDRETHDPLKHLSDPLDCSETYHNASNCGSNSILHQPKVATGFLLGPALKFGFSIPNQSYIPELLNLFRLLLPTAAAQPNSLSIHIHTTWLRRAIADPCLLHSTLFGASTYLDSLQKVSRSSRTIYHQLEAIKILRRRLAKASSQVTYEQAASVLALSYFSKPLLCTFKGSLRFYACRRTKLRI